MLDKAHVAARLPAHDLERARNFYSEKLGLEPVEERPGGLLYRLAGAEYPSKGGKGERAAWFRDSEGNLLGLGQPLR
jgi:predicted enzyme related to lactoylglutathione lyase